MLNLLGAHADVHNGVETRDRGGKKALTFGNLLEKAKLLTLVLRLKEPACL